MSTSSEEEEEFYESLDKMPSSSDNDEQELPPISADAWVSEPSSIEERRHLLLHKMGLADDPSLSRLNLAAKVSRSRSESSVNSKPPLAARPLSMPAIKFDYSRDDHEADIDIDVQRCTIKNLDTGKEFVVGQDGVGRKLREVGTGRHLSMEEFDMFVAGQSPIVQELMRRQKNKDDDYENRKSISSPKKRRGWLRSIKNAVGGGQQNCTAEEKDTSSSSSSSATADNLHGPQRTKVRHYGKPRKELTGLFMSQGIKAHDGSIWTMKFSLDGKYMASAGEDCIINVWKVPESESLNAPVLPFGRNGGLDPTLALACIDGNDHWEKKRRVKMLGRRRSASSADQLMVPEYVFSLSEKPVCSFKGHLDDVLDLSWSKSQHLLSSSMDKTVKLWHLSSNSCLKTFSHSDYVTCIQFNPVDDRYFISGSLDEKVRIWSIPDRQVVDWNDLHEMVTAACYTPSGLTALVGSHKGSCYLYNTSENSLLEKREINLENKKRSSFKKITGFQFSPASSSEVLITSADSRIRVIDGGELVRKFKGFRNTSSQISAHLTANGKYVISASEDSHVYIWKYNVVDSRPSMSKGSVSSNQCFEHFYCRDVTVAIPWPIIRSNQNGHDGSLHPSYGKNNIFHDNGSICDRMAATWPEEKLSPTGNGGGSCHGSVVVESRPAWGMVIVTAGRGGQIKIYQNFGFPI